MAYGRVGGNTLSGPSDFGRFAEITSLTSGTKVAVYDADNFSIHRALKLQFFGSDGQSTGSPIVIGPAVAGYFYGSANIATLSNGNIAVAYSRYAQSVSTSVVVKLFTATGQPIGNDIVVTPGTQGQSFVDTVELFARADGGFGVSRSGSQTLVSLFDSSGNLVRELGSNAIGYESALLSNGNNVLSTGSHWTLMDAAGNIANTYDFSTINIGSTVVALDNGRFGVVYKTAYGQPQPPQIKLAVFDQAGNLVSDSVLLGDATTTDNKIDASLLSDGNIALTWTRNQFVGASTQPLFDQAIQAQVFALNGTAVSEVLQISSYSSSGRLAYDVSALSIAAGGNGDFTVAWRDASPGNSAMVGLRTQSFSTSGAPDSAPIFTSPAAVGVAENISAAVYQAQTAPANTALTYTLSGVDAARFTIDDDTGVMSFRSAPDYERPSDSGANNIYDVIVTARSSNGSVTGSRSLSIAVSNIETFIGGTNGSDVIQAGGLRASEFTLNGLLGTDTIDYSSATAAVRVSLAITTPQAILGGTHTIGGFENITGSNFNDVLTGDAGVNQLVGGSGNDTLNGDGNDILIGGAGNDIYILAAPGDVLLESVNGGKDTVKSAFSYALTPDFEVIVLTGTTSINATGNELANTLTGNSGSNVLSGGQGKDILSGAGGNDRLIGGAAADTLTGGAGTDTFVLDSLTTSLDKDIFKDVAPGLDKIEISRTAFMAFAGHASNILTASDIAFGTAAATATQHLVYDLTSGSLYYDADGAGGNAQVLLATMSNHANLTVTDFLLI